MTKYKLTPRLRSGVTLIELILVLAISSFMIVLALGGLTNRGRSQFDDGMNQVLNNLRQVQNEAASGQLAGSKCSATMTDAQRDAAGCPKDGQEVVGKGISLALNTDGDFGGDGCSKPTSYEASGNTSSVYYEYIILRGAGSPWNNVVCALRQKQLNLPSSLVLAEIVRKDAAGVIVSSPTTDRGMVNFVRRGEADTNPSASALPYYFAQAYFSDDHAGYFFGTFTAAMAYASYSAPQSGTVTLQFQGKENAAYKAKIEINLVSGAMEIKQ